MTEVLDATLREGEQAPGVCFHEHTKLSIARYLDRVGVDVIEAGHPAVTPRIRKAVKQIKGLGLRARVAAHARSNTADVDAALDCDVDMLGVF
jgi:2-isopropylmalate synthase